MDPSRKLAKTEDDAAAADTVSKVLGDDDLLAACGDHAAPPVEIDRARGDRAAICRSNAHRSYCKMEDDAAAAAAGDAVSKVLGDDDLLAEILLRVGFPTTLVRAAAVCRHWLQHASDKAFLRRFRKRNPPRLLGFYIGRFQGPPRFVPMLPQSPELAATVRAAGGYSFDATACNGRVVPLDCRNGSVSTVLRGRRPSLVVHNPLCPERAMAIDPPLSPERHHPRYNGPQDFLILSREEKDGGLSYFYVLLENPMVLDITSATNFTVHVFIVKDGAWCMVASATTRIDHWRSQRAVLVDDKIYMMATYTEITVLDLTTSTFSTIQPPQRGFSFMISRVHDASSLYLVGFKDEDQLGIWLRKGDSWSIVDTICLQEMFANLMMSDCRFKDASTSLLHITHVGDNAEFVLLQRGQFVLYLDTRCKTLHKLYEISEDWGIMSIQPFMMIWPPTFPALKCDPTRNAM